MAFSAAEKERIRYHLGYLSAQPAASIQLGIARPIQTLFLVESAMDLLLPVAEPRVRKLLCVMDETEDRMFRGQKRLAAEQLGDLRPRADEIDRLEAEYYRWACRLADIFGVPLYPLSERFMKFFGQNSVNIPVRR